MKGYAVAMVVAVAVVASGCAEYALIRSDPPAAKVIINDKFVGLTPVEYKVSRGDVKKNYSYKVEKEGYVPVNGVLRRSVAPGRIVAAVFSMCISCAFRGFQYFPSVDVELIKEGK